MKKLHRFRKKSSTDSTENGSQRITNETVTQHRKRILAGGRRFKYPVQYARHRLVFNAIAISLAALVAIVLVVWWQLYPMQNSTTFFYRITKVVPLPVASVDGWPVRYSDYLVGFRSQEHYLQHKEGINLYSKENEQQLDYIKRKALDNAIADAYAAKLAKEFDIRVSDDELNRAMSRQRQSSSGLIPQKTYDATTLDFYNLSPSEAREITQSSLLRQEVAYYIDDIAKKQLDQVVSKLKNEDNFDKIATSISARGDARVQSNVVPLVPSNNQDGGLAETASKLKVGEVSNPFRSTTGDGYYVVKLLEKGKSDKISYAYLKIPLTVFKERLSKMQNGSSVIEYITVPRL